MGTVARTGRGEAVLFAVADVGGKFPPQKMDQPTHFPYNTALRARRLDYLITKKLLVDEVRIWDSSGIGPRGRRGGSAGRQNADTTKWGAKQLKTTPGAVEEMQVAPTKQEDRRRAIAAAAGSITEKKKGEKFVESN